MKGRIKHVSACNRIRTFLIKAWQKKLDWLSVSAPPGQNINRAGPGNNTKVGEERRTGIYYRRLLSTKTDIINEKLTICISIIGQVVPNKISYSNNNQPFDMKAWVYFGYFFFKILITPLVNNLKMRVHLENGEAAT